MRQATAFDQIAEEYQRLFSNNVKQIAAVEWLIERLPSGSHILDVGSGTGLPTARLLTEAGHHVIGVDISAEMVRIAQRQVPQATFFQADIANYTCAPGSYHAVTAFFSLLLLHRADFVSALQRIKTMLKAPSYFVLSMVEGDGDYFEGTFLGQSLHFSCYPRDVLTRLLEDLSFTVLDSYSVVFQPDSNTPAETQLYFFCQYRS